MEQNIEAQGTVTEGPNASTEEGGTAKRQIDPQPAMGQQGASCDCEETKPQAQMPPPTGPAMNTGQPMTAPGQQTGTMDPQMGMNIGQASAFGAQPYAAFTQNPGAMPGAINPQMAPPTGPAMNTGPYDPYQYAAWQAWYQQQASAMASHHPKYEAHKYGQVIDTVGRFLNGEANVGEVVDGLFSLNFQNDQFWKGALVGAVTALLVTNNTVQSGLMKTVATVFTAAQGGVKKVTETYKEATEEVKKEKK